MSCAGNGEADLTAQTGGNLGEETTEGKEVPSMYYYAENQTGKDKRRKNIERRKYDSYDYIYERPVKKPRRNKIRRYDYYNTDEEYYT